MVSIICGHGHVQWMHATDMWSVCTSVQMLHQAVQDRNVQGARALSSVRRGDAILPAEEETIHLGLTRGNVASASAWHAGACMGIRLTDTFCVFSFDVVKGLFMSE